jgi:hypothetical protein
MNRKSLRRTNVTEVKRISLVKPTLQTRYHIDYDWWRGSDRDWRVYLQNFLCEEHQRVFADLDYENQVDWVDPDTAEIQRVDGLQHVLMTHCARQAEFTSQHMTLVDSIFRLFLSNGNTPLTPVELADQLDLNASTILKTISGLRVYKGLRPVME